MGLQEIRIPVSRLSQAIAMTLTAVGVSAEMAEMEANVMVEADLQGVPSHGVRMLPGLLQAIRRRPGAGCSESQAAPRVRRHLPARRR